MSREDNIRWLKRDEERLRKAVKNYNAKIARIEKKFEGNPDKLSTVPVKQSYKHIRGSENIQTRADFNKKLEELQSFTRRYAYTPTKHDEQRLQKVVKEFNSKVNRLSKADPKNRNVLPDKLKVGQIKEILKDRADLNEAIKVFRSFTRKGAETLVDVPDNKYNLKITKWQRDFMLDKVNLINTKRAKLREEVFGIDMTSRGKKLGYKRGQLGEVGLGTPDDTNLSPMNAFTPSQQNPDIRKKYKSIFKEMKQTYWQDRLTTMKTAYIRTILKEFGTKDKRVWDIIYKIQNTKQEDFYKVFMAEKGFEDVYFPNEREREGALNTLQAIWSPNKPE